MGPRIQAEAGKDRHETRDSKHMGSTQETEFRRPKEPAGIAYVTCAQCLCEASNNWWGDTRGS